ncbi:Zinc finger BED domain-containing protein RICESLEEPER 1 [Vitis vinifera]|uniref:Zinc finger BED domain-containing protein RICESLEEPER 1 n=1 Tax=Vitis vinifera TaxID=29760 RepID=A0A438FHH6_VITVI|nr:Zinc finger BED domain-containing protein RICESLEEPER 1 [Vitis vinifera]
MPTANIYFPEICDIHIQLIEWCKSPDDFISSLALKMKAKFDKYWSKCSLALAVAVILDPRFKMKLVEYYYPQIYGNDAADRIKDVSDGIKELFNVYCSTSASLHQGVALPGSSLPSTSNDSRDRLKGFDKFIHETSQNQNIKPRYPILSMMVRDVLGIPMSTVAPEVVFSTGARVLDHYRSSLNPDTRQALICTQDWLQTGIRRTQPILTPPNLTPPCYPSCNRSKLAN